MADIKTILGGQQPLFALARRGVAEVVVSGVGYIEVQGSRLTGDDPDVVLVARALLMPWQFIACDVAGAEPFWSLGIASHSGQPHHLAALRELADKAEVDADALVCPRVWPLDPGVSSVMQNAGVTPTRLHHPCSGKHLVMLAACRHHGFGVERYWAMDHPIQKRVLAFVGQELNERPIWLPDACGIPTLALPARALSGLFLRLASSSEPRMVQLRARWSRDIRLIGGYGRLDADLTAGLEGRVLVKEGGDGLIAIVAPPSGNDPAAVCIVKLASGYSATWLSLALWSTLSRHGDSLVPPLAAVRDFLGARLEKWVPSDLELILPPFSASS